MAFSSEYEKKIALLKSEFLACRQCESLALGQKTDPTTSGLPFENLNQSYRAHLIALRNFVVENFGQFDPQKVSSLLAVPSRLLPPEERVIHRIWLGSWYPALAREATEQWNCALNEVEAASAGAVVYDSILWVWNADQLAGDPCFELIEGESSHTDSRSAVLSVRPSATSRRRLPQADLGRYSMGSRWHAVRSLQTLVEDKFADMARLIAELNSKGYHVNVSDIGRLLILLHFGGIYMDADTLPQPSVTIFLSKPELPDYIHRRDAGDGHAQKDERLNWLNLFHDENGILISQSLNMSIQIMLDQIQERLSVLPTPAPSRDRQLACAVDYSNALHEASYGVWLAQKGRTFSAYDQLALHHSIFYPEKKTWTLLGLRGMRLLKDAVTGAHMPLDAPELNGYQQCVEALNSVNWTLTDPLELEDLAEITETLEVPRMAYPPQLRSEISNCHYYSFLSQDENLDRCNALFAAYLVRKNALAMKRVGYWKKAGGAPRSVQWSGYGIQKTAPLRQKEFHEG